MGKKCKKIFKMKVSKISKFFSFGAKNKNFLGQKKRIQNFGEKRGKKLEKNSKMGKIFFFLFGEKDEKTFCFVNFQCPPPRKGEGLQMEIQVQFAARYVITPLKSPGCGVRSAKLLAANWTWVSVFRFRVHLVLQILIYCKTKKNFIQHITSETRLQGIVQLDHVWAKIYHGFQLPPWEGGWLLLPCNPLQLTIISILRGGRSRVHSSSLEEQFWISN